MPSKEYEVEFSQAVGTVSSHCSSRNNDKALTPTLIQQGKLMSALVKSVRDSPKIVDLMYQYLLGCLSNSVLLRFSPTTNFTYKERKRPTDFVLHSALVFYPFEEGFAKSKSPHSG